MKNQSFIFFTITYEINNFLNADNFLNNDLHKKLTLFIEITRKNTTIYQSFIEIKCMARRFQKRFLNFILHEVSVPSYSCAFSGYQTPSTLTILN